MFQCSQCPKVFKHKCSLNRHVKQFHLESLKKYSCLNCGGQFRDKCDLRRHNLVCNGGSSQKHDVPIQKKPKTDQDVIDFELNNIPNEMLEPWPMLGDDQDGGQIDQEECALGDNANVSKYNPNKTEKYDILLALQGKKRTIIKNLEKQLTKRGGIKWYLSAKVRMVKTSPDGDDQSSEPHFRSKCNTTINTNDIEEMFDEGVEKIKSSFLEYQREGSGWQLETVLHIDLGLVTYKPLKGASYLPLPKRIRNKKAVLNIQNRDQKCFTWSILAALYPVHYHNHPSRVNHYTQYEQELNMAGILR